MKKANILVVFFILIALAAGCASTSDKIANAVTRPVETVRFVTNVVEVPKVHVVMVTNVVAGADVVKTEWKTNIVREIQVHSETNIVYVQAPGIATGIGVAKTAAIFIPPPWNAVAEVGLMALSGVLTWLVKRKNDQKISAEDQLGAVVEGVEKYTKKSPATNLKETISDAADSAGVGKELHKTVQKLTA